MQEGLVCRRDVPWVAQEEQGFGSFHPEHLPPSHLPGVVLGTQFTSNLEPGWTGSYHPRGGFLSYK
jgi:hypothetical protein